MNGAPGQLCTWCRSYAVERATGVPGIGSLYACEDHRSSLPAIQGRREPIIVQPSLWEGGQR